jgi:hypothetical protein
MTRYLIAAACLAICAATRADDLALPDHTDDFAAFAFVENDVVIPIPSEVFNVLGKFDHDRSAWKAQLRTPSAKPCRDRIHTALYLGSVVAEGFLAVQAEDSAAVREVGRVVLDLSQSLGLRDSVLRHTNSILSASEEGRWEVVRDEFDQTRQTVRNVMKERRDLDLAHCVSIGGWLRGTEIVTGIIRHGYSEEKAEILHQPRILEQFDEAIAAMEPGLRDSPRLKSISRDFATLKPLMSASTPPTSRQVGRIQTICSRLGRSVIEP